MASKLKRKAIEMWRRHLRPILLIILVFTTFRSAIADWNDVPTGSMKPTILEGDRIFVNKLAYGLKVPFTTLHLARWGHPRRGEVVVFYAPDTGIRLVKRIVGVPGDRIAMMNERLYINGKAIQYTDRPDAPSGQFWRTEHLDSHPHTVVVQPGFSPAANMSEFTVPEGEYFVMGDNRDNSRDSRYFGTVRESEIVGRATSVVFSLDYDDHYLPRGDRFFRWLP